MTTGKKVKNGLKLVYKSSLLNTNRTSFTLDNALNIAIPINNETLVAISSAEKYNVPYSGIEKEQDVIELLDALSERGYLRKETNSGVYFTTLSGRNEANIGLLGNIWRIILTIWKFINQNIIASLIVGVILIFITDYNTGHHFTTAIFRLFKK